MTVFGREDWPEQSKMRRRSHAMVRWALIFVCIMVADGALRDHAGWPRWLRYGTYIVVVFAIQIFPRPEWPDDDEDEEEEELD